MQVENRVGVIDLGTNTFHLLLAEWSGTEYTITRRERSPVKMGMGGINNGIITEAGKLRALDAMQNFSAIIAKENVSKVVAIGTSAFRSARNSQEVVGLIKDQTGIAIRVISGDEEARYIYLGIRKALTMNSSSLIVDIGGGSVEFVIGDQRSVFWSHSFDIGAQRLLEQFQKHDPISAEEIMKLNVHFDESLKPLFGTVGEFNPRILVGSSGTFDTLSEIHCIRSGIPLIPDTPETPLTPDSFRHTFKELLGKNRNERLRIPGMIEMRVDMIVVACCLIDYLLRRISFEAIRVSSYSLKEGVLASLEGQS